MLRKVSELLEKKIINYTKIWKISQIRAGACIAIHNFKHSVCTLSRTLWKNHTQSGKKHTRRMGWEYFKSKSKLDLNKTNANNNCVQMQTITVCKQTATTQKQKKRKNIRKHGGGKGQKISNFLAKQNTPDFYAYGLKLSLPVLPPVNWCI